VKRVDPTDFRGPRAYFTDLDYRKARRIGDKEIQQREIERRLKILLLTKGTVVTAASHLVSQSAYQLFRDHPILLEKSLVIPALRQDKQGVDELFAGKSIPPRLSREMVDFYKDRLRTVASWELMDNTTWFKQNFLRDLQDENSVIRRNLASVPAEEVDRFVRNLKGLEVLSRANIEEAAQSLPDQGRNVLNKFRDLVYHMSGARVVNCESAIPQENYIDYSLADISQRRIILSEQQVFWKLFMELAFESMHKHTVPVALLDSLSFQDILAIRAPIAQSKFRENYDAIVRTSVDAITEGQRDDVLFDLSELMRIREMLAEDFKRVFEQEIVRIVKKKRLESAKELGKETVSFGLGILGFVPFLSNVAGILGLVLDSPAFIFNLSQNIRGVTELDDYESYLKHKESTVRDVINRSDISDKAPLLETVDLLMRSIMEKATF